MDRVRREGTELGDYYELMADSWEGRRRILLCYFGVFSEVFEGVCRAFHASFRPPGIGDFNTLLHILRDLIHFIWQTEGQCD